MAQEADQGEVEISPEMIEAAHRVLIASALTDHPLEADKLVVADIIRAALREGLASPSRPT